MKTTNFVNLRKVFLLVLFLGATFFGFGQDCSQILQQGIYEKDYRLSYLNWMKNNSINTYEEAQSFGASATIPIKGVMVGFGLDYNESGYSQAMNYLETYEDLQIDEKERMNIFLKNVNKDVVTAWENCVGSPGTKIWVEHTSDARKFIIHARYNSEGDEIKRFIKSIDYDKSKFSTNDGFFTDKNGKVTKKPFTSTRSQEFIRLTDEAVNITITPNQGNAITIRFKEITDRYYEEYNVVCCSDSIPNTESRKIQKIITNIKGKNVYLKIFATIRFREVAQPNGLSVRLTIKNNTTGKVTNLTDGWKRYTNIQGEKYDYLSVNGYKFPRDSSYTIEITFDNNGDLPVDNLRNDVTFKLWY
jgi:hypothetical protein